MTGLVFLAYIRRILAPALRRGDLVILDNLTTHKVASVEAAIRATGASILYLWPYSPDLNLIEQVFLKLEALLRSAAARTRDPLWTTVDHFLSRLSPAECRRHLTNSGYDFT